IFVPVVGPRIVGSGLVNSPIPQEVLPATNTDVPTSVQDALFFRLMAWIYGLTETAGAAFPSSHVAMAFCTVYFSFLYLRPIRYAHLIAAFLLCISTVYGRYHYAVDVLAGGVMAAVLVPLGNWLYSKFGNADQDGPVIDQTARS
ncbi:MAG: phosphatase PAP2 family protein, partial [Pirellulaceae bacterium]